MCEPTADLPHLRRDEYVLDTPIIRALVAEAAATISAALPPGTAAGMRLTRQRQLEPGDYYALVPPAEDIHCVRTTSEETSVSIHLLANDTGCTPRHTFDEATGATSPFVSGYANAVCADARAA